MRRDEKFPAEIRFGVVHSSHEEDYLLIDLEDVASGVTFLTVKISMSQGGRFLAQRVTPCEVELGGVDLIGCERQVKTEFVPGTTSYNNRKEDSAKALAPFEVDGWKGMDSDFGNGNRSAEVGGVKGYKVTFIRYVRPDGTPVQ